MFSFVKSRPPLVVFFTCLFTFTVTIFCFAIYIKYTDPIPDSDKNYDWLQMLKHFNSLNYCLKSANHIDQLANDKFMEMTTVQTLISINNTDVFKKLNLVLGVLTLDEWHTNCQKSYTKPSALEIYFFVPQVAESNVSKFDVCVNIMGPKEYLPKFFAPNCISTETEEKSNKGKMFVDTVTRNKLNKTFCEEGISTKFEFHPQEKGNFANFLSDEEKNVIYVHLLWTTFILVFILLIIVIYGTFQTEQIFDKYLHKLIPRNR